jgi:FKBP-type peptidyl-prolyl cis-trans isomerase FkpA
MKRLTFFLLLSAALATTACSGQTTQAPAGSDKITQLGITDIKVGSGAEATTGKTVSVHYTGWLYDESIPNHHGTRFDSSRDRGTPFEFTLGAGQVIPGWDQGVAGMKVGGQRTLLIPASLGYGERGADGVIPPNAALLFDVELLGVH